MPETAGAPLVGRDIVEAGPGPGRGAGIGAALARFGLTGRRLVIAVPYLWLLVFFLIPFLIVVKISVAESVIAIPPYTPLFERTEEGLRLNVSTSAIQFVLSDNLYLLAYLNSLKIAFVSTICCLLVGYPMAYAIARADQKWRGPLLMLIILPFWTSFLIRVYAWIGILKDNGILNNLLMSLGIIDEPLTLLYTDLAVYIGITYSYLPFMVLPLYSTLEKMDLSLLEAAADLGARPLKAFLTVTLPLSVPGIVAGSLLVFIPAVGEFVIPSLLGGSDTLMIGRELWVMFFNNRDWPAASVVAIALLAFLVVPIMVFQHVQGKQQQGA
ncbi:MAG TPA: ABC transporter permease subunit [Azospirillaceae bacterium]|nr:ABC transporter permease subunit [Azospirillaceae bacterium]